MIKLRFYLYNCKNGQITCCCPQLGTKTRGIFPSPVVELSFDISPYKAAHQSCNVSVSELDEDWNREIEQNEKAPVRRRNPAGISSTTLARARERERERSDYSISRKSLLIFNRNRTSLKSAANLNRDSIRRITNRWEEEDFFINRGNSWEINFDFFFFLSTLLRFLVNLIKFD